MAVLTGHERAMVWQWTVIGKNVTTFNNYAGAKPPDGTRFPQAEANIVLSAGGWTVAIVPYFVEVPPIPLAGEARDVRYGITITVSGAGPGGTGTNSVNLYNTFHVPALSAYTMEYTFPSDLAATINALAQEWFEELPVGSGWYRNIPDAPGYNQAHFYLQHKIGGWESASCGGATQSQASYGAGNGLDFKCVAEIGATAGDTGSSSWTSTITQAPCTYTSETATITSSTGGTATSTANNTHATVSLSANATNNITGSASATLWGDINYTASGVLRAMDEAYPETVRMDIAGHTGGTVTASSGMWATAGTQKQYKIIVAANTTNLTKELYQHGPLAATINIADLASKGDESKLSRSPWRGFLFGGIGVTQAMSVALTNNPAIPSSWDSATTTTSAGATLSPSARLTFTPPLSGLSYRYLRMEVQSTDAAKVPLLLTIPGNERTVDDYYDVSGGGSVDYEEFDDDPEPDKKWNFTTGADSEWKTILIDLCAPDNLASGTDDQDTRFPLPSLMPANYGVSRAKWLAFGNVPATGVTVRVRNIKLVLQDANPSIDYLPTFYPLQGRVVDGQFILDKNWQEKSAQWRANETLDSGTKIRYFKRRFLASRADGKAAIEESDLGYTETLTASGNLTYAFSVPSIATLAGQINAVDVVTVTPPGPGGTPARVTGNQVRYPGITATIAAPSNDMTNNLRDGYLNRDRPAICLAGGGAWYDPASGWHYGTNQTGGVPAQTLHDQLLAYPNIGDAFGHTSAGTRTGAIILHAAQILRAGGQGLVWQADDGEAPAPAVGRTLKAQEGTPATDRGTGTTNERGYAQTGLPYLHAVMTGEDDPIAKLIVDTKDTSVSPWNRRRSRATFFVSILRAYGVLAIDSPRQLLHVASNTTIRTYHLATFGFVYKSVEHPVQSWISMCFDERRARLFLVGKTGAMEHRIYRSGDGGRHIEELLTVTTKSSAIEKDSERGYLILLYQASDDTLKRRLSKDAGTTWGDPESIKIDSDAAPSGVVVSMAQDPRATGILVATVKAVSSDTGKVIRSRDAGKNWATVLS